MELSAPIITKLLLYFLSSAGCHMEAAGLISEAEVTIQAYNGMITIVKAKKPNVNTDISTWDKQFKAAKKKGALSENDLFEGMKNDFDETEW